MKVLTARDSGEETIKLIFSEKGGGGSEKCRGRAIFRRRAEVGQFFGEGRDFCVPLNQFL